MDDYLLVAIWASVVLVGGTAGAALGIGWRLRQRIDLHSERIARLEGIGRSDHGLL